MKNLFSFTYFRYFLGLKIINSDFVSSTLARFSVPFSCESLNFKLVTVDLNSELPEKGLLVATPLVGLVNYFATFRSKFVQDYG